MLYRTRLNAVRRIVYEVRNPVIQSTILAMTISRIFTKVGSVERDLRHMSNDICDGVQ